MKLISLYPEQFYSCELNDLFSSSCIKVMLLVMIRTLKRAVVKNILKKIGRICVVASLSYSANVSFKFKDINVLECRLLFFSV